MSETVIDDDLGPLGRCEPFGIQNLPAQHPIEMFILSVLPVSWIGADGLETDPSKPVLHSFGDELRRVF